MCEEKSKLDLSMLESKALALAARTKAKALDSNTRKKTKQ